VATLLIDEAHDADLANAEWAGRGSAGAIGSLWNDRFGRRRKPQALLSARVHTLLEVLSLGLAAAARAWWSANRNAGRDSNRSSTETKFDAALAAARVDTYRNAEAVRPLCTGSPTR